MCPIPAIPDIEASRPLEMATPITSSVPLINIINTVSGRPMLYILINSLKVLSVSRLNLSEKRATIKKRKVPSINKCGWALESVVTPVMNELITFTMKLLNNLKKPFFSYFHSPIIRQEAKKCQK